MLDTCKSSPEALTLLELLHFSTPPTSKDRDQQTRLHIPDVTYVLRPPSRIFYKDQTYSQNTYVDLETRVTRFAAERSVSASLAERLGLASLSNLRSSDDEDEEDEEDFSQQEDLTTRIHNLLRGEAHSHGINGQF